MLLLSSLTLFAGPALYLWLQRGGLIARTFDRVIIVVLIPLVAVLLVPETLAQLGWPAMALILAGYLVPGALEAAVKRAASAMHLASLFLALGGLMLHAMLDGAGLAGSSHSADLSLGLAIVLHRFGMGLIVWMMVEPGYGRRMAMLVLLLVVVATWLGFTLSHHVLPLTSDRTLMVIQALIIGAILHSLVHRGHASGDHGH